MTSWLICILLIDLPTRQPPVPVLLSAVAVFLFLDLLRSRTRPPRAAYLAWLNQTIDAVRRDQPAPPPLPRRFPYNWEPWVMVGMAAYIIAFVLVPPVRYPARVVEHSSIVRTVNDAICQLYSTAHSEPERVARLGHLRAAIDLRNFFAASLAFSVTVMFIWTGPYYYGLVKYIIVRPWKNALRRESPEWNRKRLMRAGLTVLIVGILALLMFTAFAGVNKSFKVYWHIGRPPVGTFPSLMFLLACWIFSWGLAFLSVVRDVPDSYESFGTDRVR